MKRALLSILISGITLPIWAQYSGEGFYRIQNQGSARRYISVVNNKVDDTNKSVDVTSVSSFVDIQIYALRTVKDPFTDPGTILYLSGSTSGLSIQAQGMNTDQLTRGYKLQNEGNFLCSEYSGVELFLSDDYDPYNKEYNMNACIISGKTRRNDAKTYAAWDIKKLDNDQQYLGVKPEVQIGDKYYTTLYTSFAYELSEGMKAYYIVRHEYKKTSEPVAEWKEMSNKIPAATPVIIECTSDKPSDNKIKPLTSAEAPAAISGNELTGVYFCFVKIKGVEGNTESEKKDMVGIKNAVSYSSTTMRVLGKVDGKLALVPASNKDLYVTNKDKYIPANKAYITIAAADASRTSKGIKIVSTEEFNTATAIKNVNADEETSKPGIYTLSGVKVKSDNSTEGLPNGIYIMGGKKFIIK